MSRRLFSLEGTGSARSNPWRYEIPVRMCLEWLVVRPLASIKPTTELLLVMPDILRALRGAGAGADTWVLEVKHTVRISHPCLHKHTHTQCFFFPANTHTAFVLRAAILSTVTNMRRELLNKQQTDNKSFYLIFFLCFFKTLRDWLCTGETNLQRKQHQPEFLPFSQLPREDNAAIS